VEVIRVGCLSGKPALLASNAGESSADRAELLDRLGQASAWEIIRLVRAFTIYFHIANTAEQHYRVPLGLTHPECQVSVVIERALAAGVMPRQITQFSAGAHIPPVFTAHSTESVRRSILSKLQGMDRQLARPVGPDGRNSSWRRRMVELIERIVQTDERRQVRPRPVDEARNSLYYLEELAKGTTRHRKLLRDFAGARHRLK
jgi:phosphoenolpyruvate carboxylase